MTDETNEQRTAAASYVLTFYQDVQQLTHYHTQYSNILVELERMFGQNADGAKITDEQKIAVVNSVQQVRYHARKVYIEYTSIFTAVQNAKKQEKTKKKAKAPENPLTKPYEKIKDQFIMKQEEIEVYVQAVNNVLVTEIMQDLLKSSQDVIDAIYNP